MGDLTKMAGAFKKRHYLNPAEFRHLQRVVKSGRFALSGTTTKGFLGEGRVRTIVNPEQIQGTSKERFPGCVKCGEKVAFCLPNAGRRPQLFHPIFTKPGKHSLEVPCIACSLYGYSMLWLISVL